MEKIELNNKTILVTGTAGCPDMAYFGFTNKLLKGETKMAGGQVSGMRNHQSHCFN